VLFGQDPVEERGLAGAEIAGEDGDGNLVGHRSVPGSAWDESVSGIGRSLEFGQLDRAELKALILCRNMSM
jgi:hypothetical protein